MPDRKSLRKYMLCGALGGMFNVGLGYPMDTIKVRLQTMPPTKIGEQPLYIGTFDCLRKTIKMDGYRGLFRGILAPLSVAGPVYAINFFGFGLGKKLIKEDPEHLTMPELFAAGAFSGLLSSVFVGPAEHVKVLLQTHDDSGPNQKYKGTIDCLQKLYVEGGIRNVFKGSFVTMLRDVPAAGMYFMTYESVRALLVTEDSGTACRISATLFSGGFAGVCFWLVGMPADVIKTRIQTDDRFRNSIRDVSKHLMATEGPRGFFSGLVPVMIKAFPANAACFFGFELALMTADWLMPDL